MKKAPSSVVWGCALAVATLPFLTPRVLTAQQDASRNGAPHEAVYHVGDAGVTPPKGISMPQPEYSDYARRKKISGSVLLGMIVQPDGTVRSVQVTRSLEKSLDQKAIEAVNKWKFQPATKDGLPVAVRVEAEVTFRIR